MLLSTSGEVVRQYVAWNRKAFYSRQHVANLLPSVLKPNILGFNTKGNMLPGIAFLFQATCCQHVAFSVEAQHTLGNILLATLLKVTCCLVYIGLQH